LPGKLSDVAGVAVGATVAAVAVVADAPSAG